MNWKHSFYQIYAISFGSSFLLEEAQRILLEQREDRQFAIASALAESQRAQAKVIDAKVVLADLHETHSNCLRARAALYETDARFLIAQPCLDMARAELAFIEYLLAYIAERVPEPASMQTMQAIQPLEYAFDYAYSIAIEGLSADMLRNVYANPFYEAIVAVGAQHKPNEGNLKERISLALAARLQISRARLTCTVNYTELETYYRGRELPAELSKYMVESERSQHRLGELIDANLSGHHEPREAVTGGD